MMKGHHRYVDQSQLQKVDHDEDPLGAHDDSGSFENEKQDVVHYVSQITIDGGESKKSVPQLSVNQQIVDAFHFEETRETPSSSPKSQSHQLTFGGSGASENSTNYVSLASSRSNSISDSRRSSVESSEVNSNGSSEQNELDSSPHAHLNAGQYDKVISEMNILDFLRYMPRISLRSLSNGKYVIASKNFDALKVMAVKPNNATQQQVSWVREPSHNTHLTPSNENLQPEKVAFRTLYHR